MTVKQTTARERKEQRRKDAEARNAAYRALTLEERLAKARNAPGDSIHEIARIERAIHIRDENAAAEAARAEKKAKNKK